MPSDFTREDVERIARLARLELTEAEIALITPQLSSFLAYAEQVQQVDTSGVPPTSHPFGTLGAWRDDTPQPSLPRSEALSQAPDADERAGLFKVPRVLG
jgi:aspartyl-tRNA(Asn)/glutamyl-tRNA(Gln) amidotransferase subunit C